MSDARDLFEPEPPEPGRLGPALLRELTLVRLTLEAIRADVEALRWAVEDARPGAAPPPAVAAPLAVGGGASLPDFPEQFRGRTGGGGR